MNEDTICKTHCLQEAKKSEFRLFTLGNSGISSKDRHRYPGPLMHSFNFRLYQFPLLKAHLPFP
jgi:hypothetical protein